MGLLGDTVRVGDDQMTERLSDLLEDFAEWERVQGQLEQAIGRVTIAASDVESGLFLLLESVLGRRAVLAFSSAPASKKVEWLRKLSADRALCSAGTAKELGTVLSRASEALGERNKTVHAIWRRLPGSRFGRIGLSTTDGKTFKGQAVTIDEVDRLADELHEVAGLLYDVLQKLRAQWGGEYPPDLAGAEVVSPGAEDLSD